jgi:hypothetical protein
MMNAVNIKIKSKKERNKGKNMCAPKCVPFIEKVIETKVRRNGKGGERNKIHL